MNASAAERSPNSADSLSNLAPVTALDGPGAEDAVRHMVVEMLARRPGNTVEVVLTRQDAWHLFGVDLGSFQEDEVPGLTLTEDVSEAQRHLQSPAARRRLLINRREALDLHALPDELAIVDLSPDAETPITISADGETTTPAADFTAPQRMPLLTRSDAFAALMAMPTSSKH